MSYWRVLSDESWQFESIDRSVAVQVRSRFRANNPEAVADAALAGLGIALLPLYVCQEDLATGRLLRILPQWTPITRFGNQITAAVAPDRIRFPRHRVFLDFIKQRLGAQAAIKL